MGTPACATSPYLSRPLRSYEDVLRARAKTRPSKTEWSKDAPDHADTSLSSVREGWIDA